MPRKPRSSPTRIYQLKVALQGVEPPVWRRVLVPSDIKLGKLHFVLQDVMGWTNSHLHQFLLRDRAFGDPSHDEDDELGFEDERKVKLDHLVVVGQSLTYEYDFGDGWTHELLVEKAVEPDHRFFYPVCVGGARACPPEDCGGVGGYEDLLRVLSDPEDEEHDNMLTWVGGFFDPEGFDVNAVNRKLRGFR